MTGKATYIHRCVALLTAVICISSLTGCTSTSSAPETDSHSNARIELPNYYASGMVLQRGKTIHIRGTVSGSNSGRAQVTARLVRGNKQYEATATANAKQRFDIPLTDVPAHTSAYTLAFLMSGQVLRTIRNVYVGDVFIAAGQSNMELNKAGYYTQPEAFNANAGGLFTAASLPQTVNDKNIHFIIAKHTVSGKQFPLASVNQNGWLPATATNSQYLGYLPQFFAKRLREQSPNVPIGIIQTAWGGTNISRHLKTGDIYANHIAPLEGYGIAGILWYQGEDDAAEQAPALQYEAKFVALINQYRSLFGQQELPFLYVQLARYTGYQYTPIVRQAQYDILHSETVNTTKNLAMVVSIDTDKGTSKIIHPLGKEILASRMASQWHAMQQGANTPSGPQAKSATPVDADNSTVTIDFYEHTAEGLVARRPNYTLDATTTNLTAPATTPLQGFEVAGIDGIFHPATATIKQGKQVVLHSDAVPTITQVRYLWNGAPSGQSLLCNSDMLPASPFLLAVKTTSVQLR